MFSLGRSVRRIAFSKRHISSPPSKSRRVINEKRKGGTIAMKRGAKKATCAVTRDALPRRKRGGIKNLQVYYFHKSA